MTTLQPPLRTRPQSLRTLPPTLCMPARSQRSRNCPKNIAICLTLHHLCGHDSRMRAGASHATNLGTVGSTRCARSSVLQPMARHRVRSRYLIRDHFHLYLSTLPRRLAVRRETMLLAYNLVDQLCLTMASIVDLCSMSRWHRRPPKP